ncbi:hypothetical protein PRBEI_2001831300 [Prionailurus iriomotensis]
MDFVSPGSRSDLIRQSSSAVCMQWFFVERGESYEQTENKSILGFSSAFGISGGRRG